MYMLVLFFEDPHYKYFYIHFCFQYHYLIFTKYTPLFSVIKFILINGLLIHICSNFWNYERQDLKILVLSKNLSPIRVSSSLWYYIKCRVYGTGTVVQAYTQKVKLSNSKTLRLHSTVFQVCGLRDGHHKEEILWDKEWSPRCTTPTMMQFRN